MLGDNVVIADGKVVSEYRSILDDLGVTISSKKSIVFKIGAFEFAKMFRVDGGLRDISPLSLNFKLLSLVLLA